MMRFRYNSHTHSHPHSLRSLTNVSLQYPFAQQKMPKLLYFTAQNYKTHKLDKTLLIMTEQKQKGYRVFSISYRKK